MQGGSGCLVRGSVEEKGGGGEGGGWRGIEGEQRRGFWWPFRPVGSVLVDSRGGYVRP